jgi:hypothetical protein
MAVPPAPAELLSCDLLAIPAAQLRPSRDSSFSAAIFWQFQLLLILLLTHY